MPFKYDVTLFRPPLPLCVTFGVISATTPYPPLCDVTFFPSKKPKNFSLTFISEVPIKVDG